jgi:membrane dipeptidase
MKVWDLHCDTLSELRRAEHTGRGRAEALFAGSEMHIDLPKLERGDYMLQSFAAFVNLGRAADPQHPEDPLVTALEEIDVFKRLMAAYPDRIAPVYAPEDIRKNAATGRISAMLTVEEAGCCKGSLGVLRRLHELGVRMMTLTWNHENELASPNVVPGDGGAVWPCRPNTETGLKPLGFEFLAEMERLHVIADVSHLSDKGFWDIAQHATRPFVASHSNCRALAPHCRNLTDEMIRALAQRGGLVGLNYCAQFLDDQPDPALCRSTTALLAKHAAHFKQVGGVEILALGSDFDGIGGEPELKNAAHLPLLADALRREGFTEDEVEQIYWRNAQRFFEENL